MLNAWTSDGALTAQAFDQSEPLVLDWHRTDAPRRNEHLADEPAGWKRRAHAAAAYATRLGQLPQPLLADETRIDGELALLRLSEADPAAFGPKTGPAVWATLVAKGIDTSLTEAVVEAALGAGPTSSTPAVAHWLLQTLRYRTLRQPLALETIMAAYDASSPTTPVSIADLDTGLLCAALLDAHAQRHGTVHGSIHNLF